MRLVIDNTAAPRAIGSYSEAAYFDGNHCQHCAARDEHLRLKRIDETNRRIFRERRRYAR